MSFRIYALAKQINVDSKKILDACKELGIEGKGSQLANLTDDEVLRLKEFFQKQRAVKKEEEKSPSPQFQRPSTDVLDKKLRTLTGSEKPKPTEKMTEKPPITEPIKTEPSITEPPKTEPPKTEPVIVKPAVITEPKVEKKPVVELPKVVAPVAEKKPLIKPSPLPEPPKHVLKPNVLKPDIKQPEVKKPVVKEPVEEKKAEPVTDKTLEEPQAPKKDNVLDKPPEPVQLPAALGRVDLTQIKATAKMTRRERELEKKREKKKQLQLEAQERQKKQQAEIAKIPKTTGYAEKGHAAATRTEGYVSPLSGVAGKMRQLDDRKKDGEKHSERRPSGSTVISGLAAVPVQKNPNRLPKTKEPAVLKPDMKLSADIIKEVVNKGTTKKLEELIHQHDEKTKSKDKDKKGKERRGGRVAGTTDDTRGGVKSKDRTPVAVAGVVDDARKKRKSGQRRNRNHEDEDGNIILLQLRRQKVHGKAVNTAAPRKSDIIIQLPCSVKQFAEATGLSMSIVIKKMMVELNIMTNLNSPLDRETCELLGTSFDLSLTIRDQISLEDKLVTSLFEEEDAPETLEPRPPVVTVLGHVDHGKTTLLDHILKINVAKGEKGGITQHIRAYRVQMENGEDITFVDTPGHEAFTEMRARGANCTDIVILVVACDDGVMPQTEEAISHAKAAGVPIIVALNKIDLPGVNVDRVIQELAAHELMPSEWGGDTEMVRCSGLTGEGVDKLLVSVQITAEIHELKANPNRAALGVALESELQAGQGVVCKALVQKGTLKNGDVVLCGTSYGKVRTMFDTLDTKRQVLEAGPSTPVNIIGFDKAPAAGSKFCVLDDISDARTIAEQRLAEEHQLELASDAPTHVTLETLFDRIREQKTVQTLNVIIRADVRGSIEAIRKELSKLDHPEVKIRILQATVGGVTEGDVQLADASDAVILAFGVVPDENARVAAERKRVQIRRYDIIYNLTDDIKKALEGMLKPVAQVKELGRAMVQKTFSISRLGTIAGCRVTSGTIERDSRIRLIRDSRIIGEYPLDSLKREKDDVKEIREGYECGMKLKGYNDLKEGDILEAYKIEEVARTF